MGRLLGAGGPYIGNLYRDQGGSGARPRASESTVKAPSRRTVTLHSSVPRNVGAQGVVKLRVRYAGPYCEDTAGRDVLGTEP